MKTMRDSNIIILDGGLGTILEDTFKQKIGRTPLWSATPVEENPESIVEGHLGFLRAGAEMIMTSTYQCSRETFEQAGYTPEKGIQIMQRSVKLADDARKAYLAEGGEKDVSVALSLGPFGSAVAPAQDFDGFYPPPFGPKGPSPDGNNTRLFPSDALLDPLDLEEEEREAVEALAEFHLWRVRAVSLDLDAWNRIDYVAFETVPHLREVRAIKLAMARFDAETRGPAYGGGLVRRLKGWWISLVFPGGEGSVQWGQEERVLQAQSLGVDLIEDPGRSEILNVVLDDKIGAVPTGLGVNCTRIDHYPSILSSIASSYCSPERSSGKVPIPLTLVVYPNGGRSGDRFDNVTRSWINDGKPRADGRNITWEEEVVEVVQNFREGWKDVIVGGCCRVYPPQIKTLREKVNEGL